LIEVTLTLADADW